GATRRHAQSCLLYCWKLRTYQQWLVVSLRYDSGTLSELLLHILFCVRLDAFSYSRNQAGCRVRFPKKDAMDCSRADCRTCEEPFCLLGSGARTQVSKQPDALPEFCP